jgi:hypothetical protein
VRGLPSHLDRGTTNSYYGCDDVITIFVFFVGDDYKAETSLSNDDLGMFQ